MDALSVHLLLLTVYSLDSVHYLFGNLDRQNFLWVEEHCRAYTVFPVGAVEDIYIDAAFTTSPECFIIGKIIEGNGEIP